MTWRKAIIIFFVIIFCLFSQTGSAQKEKAYQYKRKVFLVDLQVSVFDKNGIFVEGLKPEDFIIIDEDQQQEISHFDYIVHDRQNMDLISQAKPAHRRQFLLLFDLSFTSRRFKHGFPSKRGLVNARRAGLNFINMILPTDKVAVFTYSSFQGLKVLVDFTNNKNQLREAINLLGLKKAAQLHDSLLDTFEEAPLSEDIAKATEELLIINHIDQLQNLAQALNTIEGKKNIIYFSEGFTSIELPSKQGDPLKRDNTIMLNLQVQSILRRFVSSNCVIHTVDVGGLSSSGVSASAMILNPLYTNSFFSFQKPGHTTLFFMANETGGLFFYNMNDFSKALKDILDSTSRYYIIGYYPKDVGKKGKFRKIKVKINRPGLKVAARKGYYEDKLYKKYSPLEKKIKLAEIIVKDIIYNDIEFEALVSVFPGDEKIARLPIFFQLPGKQFLKEKGEEQTKLEMYGYLIDDKGYFKDFFFGHFKIDVKKSEQKLESNGLKFYDMLLAPPGKHKVKLIVQDSDTGQVGSEICSIEVPDYQSNELTMSPPIFLDNDMGWIMIRGYDPDNPKGRKEGLPVSYPFTLGNMEFLPAVIPELRVEQPTQFCLKVYNLMLHPEAKTPQTNMNFEIIYPDGSSSKIEKISLVNKPTQADNNCFELLFQFMLEKIPPGEYKLKVTIIDNLAGKQVESSSPFILKP